MMLLKLLANTTRLMFPDLKLECPKKPVEKQDVMFLTQKPFTWQAKRDLETHSLFCTSFTIIFGCKEESIREQRSSPTGMQKNSSQLSRMLTGTLFGSHTGMGIRDLVELISAV